MTKCSDKDKLFEDYCPERRVWLVPMPIEQRKTGANYIKEVYETIVTRDLVQKYALPDTLVLQTFE